MRFLTFHRYNILQLGIHTQAGVIDVTHASAGRAEIPLLMDEVIRPETEAKSNCKSRSAV